jgi:renalase
MHGFQPCQERRTIFSRITKWNLRLDYEPGRQSCKARRMTKQPTSAPIVVVGAGLSGLIAARMLEENGHASVVFDKAQSVGGRMATRRLTGHAGTVAMLDHGAQFFTARSTEFQAEVDRWMSLGIAREWCRGFGATQDGYPRYCAPDGMNAIAKHLASSVRTAVSTTVRSVRSDGDQLVVATVDGVDHVCRAVLLTPPVPQSLALCDNGPLVLPRDERHALEAVRYARCMALLVTVNQSGLIGAPGGLQLTADTDASFSFIADNQSKGVSATPALTFHANDAFSEVHYDDPDEELVALLVSVAQPYLKRAEVVAVEVKRWRFARPTVTHPQHCLAVHPTPSTSLVFAGDAFGEARVEGAYLSGLAAAQRLIS